MKASLPRGYPVLFALYEAQSKALASLFRAEDQKSEATAQSQRENLKFWLAQEIALLPILASIESQIMGQVQAALAGYPVSISAPTGFPGISELAALAAEGEDVEDAMNLLKALTRIDRLRRFFPLPHPRAVIKMLGLQGRELELFSAFASDHDRAIGAVIRKQQHPQLQTATAWPIQISPARQQSADTGIEGFFFYLLPAA